MVETAVELDDEVVRRIRSVAVDAAAADPARTPAVGRRQTVSPLNPVEVAVLQDQALAMGILELRNAAMTLRTQAAQYLGQDLANAASIGTISV